MQRDELKTARRRRFYVVRRLIEIKDDLANYEAKKAAIVGKNLTKEDQQRKTYVMLRMQELKMERAALVEERAKLKDMLPAKAKDDTPSAPHPEASPRPHRDGPRKRPRDAAMRRRNVGLAPSFQ